MTEKLWLLAKGLMETWYFKWFQYSYSPFSEEIAVEYSTVGLFKYRINSGETASVFTATMQRRLEHT